MNGRNLGKLLAAPGCILYQHDREQHPGVRYVRVKPKIDYKIPCADYGLTHNLITVHFLCNINFISTIN